MEGNSEAVGQEREHEQKQNRKEEQANKEDEDVQKQKTSRLVILGEDLLQCFSAPAPAPYPAEASRLVRLGEELLLLGLQRAGLQQEEEQRLVELLGEVVGRMKEGRSLGPGMGGRGGRKRKVERG